MTSERELLRAVRDFADFERVVSRTGVSKAEIRNLFDKVEEKLWKKEVADKGTVPFVEVSIDGASRGNPGHSSAGIVIKDENGVVLESTGVYLGEMTNNQAEYNALLIGLEKASEFGATRILIKTDSELVAKQIAGVYRVKNANMIPLYERCTQSLKNFKKWEIVSVPRAENKFADSLANTALDNEKKKGRF